jgi:type IV secretion system protein TrbI
MAGSNGLSSTASPQRMRVAGVRRLNRKPIYLLGGISLAVLGILCWVAAERGSQQAKPAQDDHGGSATEYAQELAGDRLSGVVAPAREPTPTPVQVLAPATVAPVAAPTPDEMQRRRMEAYLAALKAKPGVEGDGFQQVAQKRTQQLDAQQVAMLRKADPNNAVNASLTEPVEPPNGNPENPNDLANFQGPRDRFTLNSKVEYPRTPYVLQTGSIIPAVSMAIDSDLPGAVTAQVSQNVYDSPSSKYLLIPQGAKLYGEYASRPEYGQSRVFVVWQRIILPDGGTLDLGAMPGVDEQGQSGFHDQTNNHFVRTFVSALAMTGVTAGLAISQGSQQFSPYGGGTSMQGELSQALGQNLGNVVADMTRRNLNIPPTLKIRPGYRFAVQVSKDITFQRPYRVSNY